MLLKALNSLLFERMFYSFHHLLLPPILRFCLLHLRESPSRQVMAGGQIPNGMQSLLVYWLPTCSHPNSGSNIACQPQLQSVWKQKEFNLAMRMINRLSVHHLLLNT